MKTRAIKTLTEETSRERLDQLIDAIALVIARRQMRHYWAQRDRRHSSLLRVRASE
jgi:hypothetical protein